MSVVAGVGRAKVTVDWAVNWDFNGLGNYTSFELRFARRARQRRPSLPIQS